MKVEIEDLKFAYNGREVLQKLDLSIDNNEFIGLVGPNGSGKTTLLKNIGGVLEPEGGGIYFDGKSLHGFSAKEIATMVAALQQENQVGFDFTVREVVEMGRFPHLNRFERHDVEDHRAVDWALRVTDLEDFSDRYVNQLSGGEKQRVFLALALAQEPDLLLLDEPTSSLDINYQIKIMETVSSLKDEGITVIAAIHDLNLAAHYTDRIGMIDNGKIKVLGEPCQVLTQENIARTFGVEVEVKNADPKDFVHIFPRRRASIN
ncbi:MAG: ABC transporter ATP-binding protein [Candidatus Bipolaricaulota bacterium]